MVTDNRLSDLADPLENYSGLSLFPKTFKVSPDDSNPHDFDRQLHALHTHLKSMALRSPDKLREQAKKIIDGSSKSLSSKIVSDQAAVDKNEALPAVPEVVDPRDRRPALNRKRARFSLQPDSSHPAVISVPTLDIKKLKDPVEFFKAYERHENAKREIQKHLGGIMLDTEEQNPSLVQRPRRPGILGHDERRSVKYKHLYSSLDFETNKNVSSSQETNNCNILSPVYHSSQEETVHDFASQETELVGSIAKEDQKVDEILNQLLSLNGEDLEGDGAVNILQERLQIKPLKLEKLQLPDFLEIPKIDLKSSRIGKLPRHSQVLSDIDNLLQGPSSKTPMKHRLGVESPISYVASPTPPKNPFASLSLLNQRILRSSVSNDPFSAHDIDQPVRNASSTNSLNKEFDLVDEGTQSKETAFENGDNIEVAQADTSKRQQSKEPVGDSSCTDGLSKELNVADEGTQYKETAFENGDNREVAQANSSEQDVALNMGSSASHVPVDDNTINSDMDNQVMNSEACECETDECEQDVVLNMGSSASHVPVDDNTINSDMDNQVMNSEACECETDEDAEANGTTVEQVEKTLQETLVPTQTGLTTVDSALENLNSMQSHLDKPSTASIRDQATDGNSGIPDNGSEQRTEIEEEHPEMPLNKKRKANAESQKAPKRREISGRKSLAGAGTSWESGVRRSTRIRCRPLEFWKGERLLYGRVHNSLPTVIGMKYASPGNADRGLKVKSFVSEEHKELVELAGLH